MSVSVNYRASEEIVDDGYAVKVAVTAAEGIAQELFVFRAGGRFSHVATLRDVANYPPGEAAARALGHPFFRATEMVYVAPSPQEAREARNQIVARLRAVVAARKASTPPDFGGVVEESIT